MMRFKRHSFGLGQRLEQNEDVPVLDLSKEVSQNMRELLNKITKKEHIYRKENGFPQQLLSTCEQRSPNSKLWFTPDEIAPCLRVSLINPAKEVRAA